VHTEVNKVLAGFVLDYQEAAARPPRIWLLNPYQLNYQQWGLHRLFSPYYLARSEENNRSYDYSELLLETHPPQWGAHLLWHTPMAIYAYQRSDRMFAQRGTFTIHGTRLEAIDKLFCDRPDILRKVDLPTAAIPKAREFLRLAGIGHRQLFPDLDGVARSLCEKFGFVR
jgi:hypothetical protein